MKKMRKFEKRAFTLVELLVVIGIIALLAAILLPAIRAAFVKADRNKAEIECRAVKNAVQAFLNDYGKLPVAATGDHGQADKTYEESTSKLVVKILTANDDTANPRKIAYLESQTNSTDGTFTDPWEKQYRIVMDTNYDNKTRYDDGQGGGPKDFGTICIAVSAGPNGVWNPAGTTKDDISSAK